MIPNPEPNWAERTGTAPEGKISYYLMEHFSITFKTLAYSYI